MSDLPPPKDVQRLTISVVMPAYNASTFLPKVLPPLLDMQAEGEVDEVIVVDDCSNDDTAARAREMGAQILSTNRKSGPGAARNLAAERARGDILWFVDSDVIVWKGGAAKIRESFADSSVDAVFGSYDKSPDGQPWLSRYKNLAHRYYHQAAQREATTFWAGCGAIRAEVFRKLGGFDVEIYPKPSIEDIELGYRIRRAGGRIRLLPELQGKHLKVWTLKNLIHTDIFQRALPWSRLMIAREGLIDDLNTSMAERARAVIAGLTILSILALPLAPSYWPVSALLLAGVFAVNWRFFRFLRRNGSTGFAIASLLYHQLYYVYSSVAFAWCLFEYHVLGIRDRLHVR